MIYRLSSCNEEFMVLHIEPKELRSKMGDDILIHMGAAPRQYLDYWVKPDVTFYIPEDFPQVLKIPDITLWSEYLVLNEKAHALLSDSLSGYGEFLPLNCEGNDYYILNVLKMVDDIGGVDEEQSIRHVESDILMGIDKLKFNENIVADTLVFRTAFDDHQRIFCCQAFRQLIENAGLNGIRFKTDLEGLF